MPFIMDTHWNILGGLKLYLRGILLRCFISSSRGIMGLIGWVGIIRRCIRFRRGRGSCLRICWASLGGRILLILTWTMFMPWSLLLILSILIGPWMAPSKESIPYKTIRKLMRLSPCQWSQKTKSTTPQKAISNTKAYNNNSHLAHKSYSPTPTLPYAAAKEK